MAARRSNWDNDDASWDERNWDAVRKQEQKKQDVLVMASQNSESIRRMVRQVDETRNVAGETLTTLDQQSGLAAIATPTFPHLALPVLVATRAIVAFLCYVVFSGRLTTEHLVGPQTSSSVCMGKSTRWRST